MENDNILHSHYMCSTIEGIVSYFELNIVVLIVMSYLQNIFSKVFVSTTTINKRFLQGSPPDRHSSISINDVCLRYLTQNHIKKST